MLGLTNLQNGLAYLHPRLVDFLAVRVMFAFLPLSCMRVHWDVCGISLYIRIQLVWRMETIPGSQKFVFMTHRARTAVATLQKFGVLMLARQLPLSLPMKVKLI